ATTEFKRDSFFSEPTPVSFAGVPAYVLTSGNTFSGGEELAYDMQTLKLGTVVGEVTGVGSLKKESRLNSVVAVLRSTILLISVRLPAGTR
ncbi:MAG: hypothetical protein EOP89_08835, partial [Lysobacteraceae bacterium]